MFHWSKVVKKSSHQIIWLLRNRCISTTSSRSASWSMFVSAPNTVKLHGFMCMVHRDLHPQMANPFYIHWCNIMWYQPSYLPVILKEQTNKNKQTNKKSRGFWLCCLSLAPGKDKVVPIYQEKHPRNPGLENQTSPGNHSTHVTILVPAMLGSMKTV